MENRIADLIPDGVQISVSKELEHHFRVVLAYRDKLVNGESSLAKDSEVISSLNAATSIIKEMSKLQAEVYNSEKFAKFQQVLVSVLKEVDPSIAEEFISECRKQRIY